MSTITDIDRRIRRPSDLLNNLNNLGSKNPELGLVHEGFNFFPGGSKSVREALKKHRHASFVVGRSDGRKFLAFPAEKKEPVFRKKKDLILYDEAS